MPLPQPLPNMNMNHGLQNIISQQPGAPYKCRLTIILRTNKLHSWAIIHRPTQIIWLHNRIQFRPVHTRVLHHMEHRILTPEDTECQADIHRNVRMITTAEECTTESGLE